ncbi:Fanconi anemia group E protein [Merluccius polli]|uniref:Fanconi anemia group E protein n=1 Tax=Merluccius polli TaxID=89951 RepID=A0AA47M2S4_MERPO|nr:Fanconi anemia group E protein [Merluccius polli]
MSGRTAAMDVLTARFDGQPRLLVLALMSGSRGARRAVTVFEKQRRRHLGPSLGAFLGLLCQHDVHPGNHGDPVLPSPLVCLFPVAFKRNLLSFLRLVLPVLPVAGAVRLLGCLSQEDPRPDPWVTALVGQLRRDLGSDSPQDHQPLCTATCGRRINDLAQRLTGAGGTGGWTKCFTDPMVAASHGMGGSASVVGQQKKRKSSLLTPDADVDEAAQQYKRRRMDASPVEEGWDGGGSHVFSASGEHVMREETSERGCDVPAVVSGQQPASDLHDVLPEDIKASVPRMKELLECPTEVTPFCADIDVGFDAAIFPPLLIGVYFQWDQSSTDVFQVLNECDSAQVELLCGMLSLADTPEEMLPKLCSCMSALSPELSYSAAIAVIKSLLLGKVISMTLMSTQTDTSWLFVCFTNMVIFYLKVLSLLEPASRCLVTAVTSLCRQYPRAACDALIRPILQEGNIGTQQAELLNRIIEDCLEPHYNVLVFQTTFHIVWSESVLSIIYSLLDSKLDVNEKLFTDFVEQLVSQAPQFIKSMKYAKIMLTVLTKYSCHVTAAHKPSLSHCLMLNQTFLKKSLHTALKRITHQ